MDHSPDLPIVPVSEKTILYGLPVVYGERARSVLLHDGRAEQLLFLIQVFIIAVLILNKCDLRLFLLFSE